MRTDLTIIPLVLSKVMSEKGPMTYLAYHGQPVVRPYVMWYVRAKGKNVLIDTAIEAEDYTHYNPAFSSLPLEAVQTFEEALAKVNCHPDDIDIIIQTHLHMDHMYNNPKCRNAVIYVQERELEFAMNPHVIFEIVYPTEMIKTLNFEIIRGDREILPGISVMLVPGHSPGCQAVMIDTTKGKAVISGFCSIMENFTPPEDVKMKVSPFATQQVIAPGIHVDLFQAYESTLKVKQAADIIIPMHDFNMAMRAEIP
jgi:N-acyl homoserine lactone hydrolase